VRLVPAPLRRYLPDQPPEPDPECEYPVRPARAAFARCAEYGLLDRPEPRPGTEERVLRRLHIVEDWLAGAESGADR
jgi:hypothetical protein